MSKIHRLAALAGSLVLTLAAAQVPVQAQAQAQAQARAQAQGRDGAHDFDFVAGTWHTHITRILDPFDGGKHTATLEGTVTERKLWGGKAWLEEIEADGPDGHWSGMTVFLYNPHSRQWSQTYAGADDGQTWADITADAHTYTEAYSDDGGETWVPAFIAYLTRLKP